MKLRITQYIDIQQDLIKSKPNFRGRGVVKIEALKWGKIDFLIAGPDRVGKHFLGEHGCTIQNSGPARSNLSKGSAVIGQTGGIRAESVDHFALLLLGKRLEISSHPG